MISVATTSMPTPRPADCVTLPAVEKPGSRISCSACSSDSSCFGVVSPSATARSRTELEVDARAVVGDRDDDFRALALQRHVDHAGLVLAGRDARRRQLDAVDDGVAQHVLERREHALEHLAVEFAGRAVDADLDLLAGLGRGLARDARQALDVALERDHARAHQPALQLGDDAPLLRQQVLHLARLGREQALHARDVRRGLRERARVLLDRGIAVELERVEVVAPRARIHVAMQDLRLGLDLELAQLVLQALHDAAELGEVEVDRRHLLLEPRAVDADLARDVQHVVEEVGVDARNFAAVGGRIAHRRPGGRAGRRRAPRLRRSAPARGAAAARLAGLRPAARSRAAARLGGRCVAALRASRCRGAGPPRLRAAQPAGAPPRRDQADARDQVARRLRPGGPAPT